MSEMQWKTVPVEPTREMLHAAKKALWAPNRPKPEYMTHSEKHAHRYREMLKAAPQPPKPKGASNPWSR